MKYKTDMNTPAIINAPADNKEYLHTYAAGALLPFTQATITAVLIFIGTFVFAWLVLDMLDPIKPAIALAVISWIGTWLSRQHRWLLLTTERITQIDLNNDGVIGDDEPEVIRIQYSRINENGNYQSSEMDLPISRDQMIALAEGLLRGVPFSEKKWAGAGLPFSSNEFRALRPIMLKRGLIELVNEKDARQGFRLTDDGRSVMEYFAPPSPPPPSEMGETE